MLHHHGSCNCHCRLMLHSPPHHPLKGVGGGGGAGNALMVRRATSTGNGQRALQRSSRAKKRKRGLDPSHSALDVPESIYAVLKAVCSYRGSWRTDTTTPTRVGNPVQHGG